MVGKMVAKAAMVEAMEMTVVRVARVVRVTVEKLVAKAAMVEAVTRAAAQAVRVVLVVNTEVHQQR